MIDTTKIEQRAEEIAATGEASKQIAKAPDILINEKTGALQVSQHEHLVKMAMHLSRSGVAVPPHCRDNPGAVYALLVQATEWGLPAMAVINQSYATKGKGGVERIAYQAQLVHTLVETRADLKEGLRSEFIGEGDEMICRVTGTRKSESEPRVWESEKLGKIRADIGTNDQGNFKGSPLWQTKPKMQLHYSTTRDWARAHTPWVILGVYALDEIEDAQPMDVTPKVTALAERLRIAREHAHGARGFDVEHVEREAHNQRGNSIMDAATTEETVHGDERDRAAKGHGDVADREGWNDRIGSDGEHQEQAGRAAPVDGTATHEPEPAAEGTAADEQDQSEIFPPDRKPQPPKPRRRR